MLKILLPLALIALLVAMFWTRSRASESYLRRGARPLKNDQLEALFGH